MFSNMTGRVEKLKFKYKNEGKDLILKGTVAPDYIELKVVWLDRPWWV